MITATGDRAFCAGMDLTRVSGSTSGTPERREKAVYSRLLQEGSHKPLIGAINGTAVAGGFELALTGRPIDAHRAFALGLVNRVVPREDVLGATMELAETIAANRPNAVRITRELLRDATALPSASAWDNVRAAIPDVMTSTEAREGLQAFLEKRTPNWA